MHWIPAKLLSRRKVFVLFWRFLQAVFVVFFFLAIVAVYLNVNQINLKKTYRIDLKDELASSNAGGGGGNGLMTPNCVCPDSKAAPFPNVVEKKGNDVGVVDLLDGFDNQAYGRFRSAIEKTEKTQVQGLACVPGAEELCFQSLPYFGRVIVHFDLKGAVPRVAYLEWLLHVVARAGATGILVEYEDAFPYIGTLTNASSKTALTLSDITRLQTAAHKLGLTYIPLIQTFGHMEFILKLEEFVYLREVKQYPQGINPCDVRSMVLIEEMVDQIMDAHPNLQFIHIGCDEVYHLGQGKECAATDLSRDQIFINHVVNTALYIRRKRPSIRVLIWDDMIRGFPDNYLNDTQLTRLVEPVVWWYAFNPRDYLGQDIWKRYGETFGVAWGASAFKGATGPMRYWNNVTYHILNNRHWLDVLHSEGKDSKLRFEGVFLTGWQRYDHFAGLCELIPAAMPSLMINLLIYKYGKFDSLVYKEAAKLLECSSGFPIIFPTVAKYEANDLRTYTSCKFHGADIYTGLLYLRYLREKVLVLKEEQAETAGWLDPFHGPLGFSSPSRMHEAMGALQDTLDQFRLLRVNLMKLIAVYYDVYTAEEFDSIYVEPYLRLIEELDVWRERNLKHVHWPRRPLTFRGTLNASHVEESRQRPKAARRWGPV